MTSPGSWHGFSLSRGIYLEGVSCPSASLCVAVSDFGDVYSSANLAGGPGAWHKHSKVLDNPGPTWAPWPVRRPRCASRSTEPANRDIREPRHANPTWSVVNLGSDHQLGSVSCPSSTRCLVLDFNGAIRVDQPHRRGIGVGRDECAVRQRRSAQRDRVCLHDLMASWPTRSVRWSPLLIRSPLRPSGRRFTLTASTRSMPSPAHPVASARGRRQRKPADLDHPAGGSPAWVRTRGVDPSSFSPSHASRHRCASPAATRLAWLRRWRRALAPAWRLTPQLGSGAGGSPSSPVSPVRPATCA